MADTPSTQTPGSAAGQSTRQLLDELDSLMERMLALPVEKAEDETDAVGNKDDYSPKVKSTPSNVTLRPPPTSLSAEMPAVVVAGDIPAFWPKNDRSRKSEPLGGDAPTTTADAPPAVHPVLPILLQRPRVPTEQRGPVLPPFKSQSNPSTSEAQTAPRPIWLKTAVSPAPQASEAARGPEASGGLLVFVNAAFDVCTILLGPLGRWLRGEQGRAFIGLCGIAMLVAAAVWALILISG